jgi:hypothetical protein
MINTVVPASEIEGVNGRRREPGSLLPPVIAALDLALALDLDLDLDLT